MLSAENECSEQHLQVTLSSNYLMQANTSVYTYSHLARKRC